MLILATGGLLFTSYLHVPAYVKNSSDESLLTQWQTMGSTGQFLVPSLALIATGANFVNSYLTHGQPQQYRFLTAGTLSLAILPYTFVALNSTNDELTARAERKEAGGGDLRTLIKTWSDRSLVRGFLLLASAIASYDAMVHLTF